jgi:hypothetical protein
MNELVCQKEKSNKLVQGFQQISHIAFSGLFRNPIDPYIIRKLQT